MKKKKTVRLGAVGAALDGRKIFRLQYLITFLEGIISFLSPCMLPMLPVYLSYFAGGIEENGSKIEENRSKGKNPKEKTGVILPRVVLFVLGFTVVFTSLGLFAGTLGLFLAKHQTAVNAVCGAVVILFGFSYLDFVHLPFFRGMRSERSADTLVSAFVFGAVYSVSLTPCVGAFLGSALMLASTGGAPLQGAVLLMMYSLGLGVPFVLSALLIEQLGGAFRMVKRHYRILNRVCGGFLIAVGILMASGRLNALLAAFS